MNVKWIKMNDQLLFLLSKIFRMTNFAVCKFHCFSMKEKKMLEVQKEVMKILLITNSYKCLNICIQLFNAIFLILID